MVGNNVEFQCQPVHHVPLGLIPPWMKIERTRVLTKPTNQQPSLKNDDNDDACIIYWMQRDIRTVDNWALLFALYLAQVKYDVPLRVIYVLQPPPPASSIGDEVPNLMNLPMTKRHGDFLLSGLQQVHEQLKNLNIPLHVIMSKSNDLVGKTVCEHAIDKYKACAIICDMTPIRQYREWIEIQTVPILDKEGTVPLYQVDAHNVVPVWIASPKREYGARTIRSKIQKIINEYLHPYPPNVLNKQVTKKQILLPDFDRESYETYMQMNESVCTLEWATPGTDGGMKQLEYFIQNGLAKYDVLRNDPNQRSICSNLSPWINHGHVSFQRIAYDVKKLNKYANGTASFLEEGIIRRELSDNFCFYAPHDYDTLNAAYDWAKETLQHHSSDTREYIYTLTEFETGCTHDDLWNAIQLQAVRDGKIHGFLRMYWAKKILEWTQSPEQALQYGYYLNDKFNIDGRDPNGFVGVGWSIMGIHDQGWQERPVFGKIRFMNYAGCKRKFDVAKFVAKYKGAAENAARYASSTGTVNSSKDKTKRKPAKNSNIKDHFKVKKMKKG